MHIKRNPDGTKQAQLTYEEGQTYTLLGMLATMSGKQELHHDIQRGKRSAQGRLGGGLTRWMTDQVPEQEMLEMRNFRNKLLHGLCIVFEDGSIEISDEQLDDNHPESLVKYTLTQLYEVLGSWLDKIHVDEYLIDRYQVETGNPHPIQIEIRVIELDEQE